MRSSAVIMSALVAAVAVAGPLDKRVMVTDVVVDKVTVTIGGRPPASSTPAPAPPAATSTVVAAAAPADAAPVENKNFRVAHHKHKHTSTVKPAPAPPATTAVAVAPSQPASTSKAAAAPASTTAASSGSDSGTGTAPPASDYSSSALYNHNIHRANHSAPDLTWDDNLASIAQQIASSCQYAHNVKAGGGGYGQNIAAGAKAADVDSVITDQFYNNEIGLYPGYGGEPNMGDFDGWGHFSQVVWKNSKTVGCYTQDCSGQGLGGVSGDVPPQFTVCNYKPAGNYAGEYASNVLAPSKKMSTYKVASNL